MYKSIPKILPLILSFSMLAGSAILTTPSKVFAANTTYYVTKTGNNNNTGTQSSPFLTIGKCMTIVAAGDTCLVGDGEYIEGDLNTNNSGTSANPITIKSLNKWGAVVNGNGNSSSAFAINGTSNKTNYKAFITVDGFEGKNTKFACFGGEYNHHLTYINNKAHDCGGGGFSPYHTDYVTIKNNVSYNNAYTSAFQESGVSIYQARDVDTNPGFHNVISGNLIYLNKNTVPNGYGLTDGNGIIIDDFRSTQNADNIKDPYTQSTLVENNIVFGNGGKGIHSFDSNKVTVRNNTVVSNNRILEGADNGELSNIWSSDNKWYNNAIISVASDRSGVLIANTAFNVPGNEHINNIFQKNLGYRTNNTTNNLAFNDSIAAPVNLSQNSLGINPLLTDPLNATVSANNFKPLSNSPLINAADAANSPAVDFFGNPRGSQPDIGAIEFISTAVSSSSSSSSSSRSSSLVSSSSSRSSSSSSSSVISSSSKPSSSSSSSSSTCSPQWSPLSLSPKIWIDAGDSSKVIKNSSNKVSQVIDKSGNGINFSQTNPALQPQYDPTAKNLEFVNSRLESISFASSNIQNATVVLKSNKDQINYAGVIGGPGNQTNAGHTINVPVPTASTKLGQNGTAGLSNSFLNGNPNTTGNFSNGTIFTFSGNVNSRNRTNFWLGEISGGNRNWNGFINEVVLTTTAPSVADRQKLEGYLAHKWGTTSALPAAHPYKTNGSLFGYCAGGLTPLAIFKKVNELA